MPIQAKMPARIQSAPTLPSSVWTPPCRHPSITSEARRSIHASDIHLPRGIPTTLELTPTLSGTPHHITTTAETTSNPRDPSDIYTILQAWATAAAPRVATSKAKDERSPPHQPMRQPGQTTSEPLSHPRLAHPKDKAGRWARTRRLQINRPAPRKRRREQLRCVVFPPLLKRSSDAMARDRVGWCRPRAFDGSRTSKTDVLTDRPPAGTGKGHAAREGQARQAVGCAAITDAGRYAGTERPR